MIVKLAKGFRRNFYNWKIEISILVVCRHKHQDSKEWMDASGIIMYRRICKDCKNIIDEMYFQCGKYASKEHSHYKDCL